MSYILHFRFSVLGWRDLAGDNVSARCGEFVKTYILRDVKAFSGRSEGLVEVNYFRAKLS